jgi:hypothetical protein
LYIAADANGATSRKMADIASLIQRIIMALSPFGHAAALSTPARLSTGKRTR